MTYLFQGSFSCLEGLRDYFGRFGEVNECMVMRDPATKRAR